MIEHFKLNRKEFIQACKVLHAALRLHGGFYTVTLHFEPGSLRLQTDWGAAVVTTDGCERAIGTIAFSHIQRLVANQGIKKLEKETLRCILAPGYGKFVIEDGVLKVAF